MFFQKDKYRIEIRNTDGEEGITEKPTSGKWKCENPGQTGLKRKMPKRKDLLL